MANNIIVDKTPTSQPMVTDKEAELVSWVMSRVDRWRKHRDDSFKERWDEYYRIWRGRWVNSDKNRKSERSRLVTPASASALEQTVSEMEEATFGREMWFDVMDDDKQNGDALAQRDMLLYDTYKTNVPDAISESFLNGGLYGQLISKIVVLPSQEKVIERDPETGRLAARDSHGVSVTVEAVPADEFVPDPSGRTIEEMLGAAHEVLKPLHYVQKHQATGVYLKVPVYSWQGGDMADGGDKGMNRGDLERRIDSGDESAFITEYHGLIPARLLPTSPKNDPAAAMMDAIIDAESVRNQDDEVMVEAIVTIANKTTLLRAVKNPFILQDRAFVSTQFEKVPGRFWGRGVMEKGYNPQKALDAEVRSRIDALGLISHPMMGGDLTRLPRGFDMSVRPGKFWGTNGAPKDILQPIQFAGLEPATFNQASEMEKMIEKATGAFDLTQMAGGNDRTSASGASMIGGAFIKRSKRAMQNVSRNYLSPIVRKIMLRYMQFEPDRYQQDYAFRTIPTMGIMAREFEQAQLTQLMGNIPDDQASAKLLMLKAIIENSSSSVKKELNDAIDNQLKQQNSPEAQQAQQKAQQLQEQLQQLAVQKAQLENAKIQAEIDELRTQAELQTAKAQLEDEKITLAAAQVQVDNRKVELLARQNEIAAQRVEIERMKANSGNQ